MNMWYRCEIWHQIDSFICYNHNQIIPAVTNVSKALYRHEILSHSWFVVTQPLKPLWEVGARIHKQANQHRRKGLPKWHSWQQQRQSSNLDSRPLLFRTPYRARCPGPGGRKHKDCWRATRRHHPTVSNTWEGPGPTSGSWLLLPKALPAAVEAHMVEMGAGLRNHWLCDTEQVT
jgi:hypothetical protein